MNGLSEISFTVNHCLLRDNLKFAQETTSSQPGKVNSRNQMLSV